MNHGSHSRRRGRHRERAAQRADAPRRRENAAKPDEEVDGEGADVQVVEHQPCQQQQDAERQQGSRRARGGGGHVGEYLGPYR